MCFQTELPPQPFDLSVYSTQQSFLWDPQWHAVTGVTTADFLLDVRNVTLGSGATLQLKPALQFAATRVDRPDAGALITAGSGTGADGLTHYQESVAGGNKFFFRRGVGFKLVAGSFARAEGLLYTAYRSLGKVLPAEEIVFNPTNDTNAVSYFPLGGGRPVPTTSVDTAKLAVFGMGNLGTKLEWRLAARAFNDPMARGSWTDLGAGWNNPQTNNFDVNTGDLAFSGITLTNFQWLELALAVRKNANGDPNSRCIFQVLTALKTT